MYKRSVLILVLILVAALAFSQEVIFSTSGTLALGDSTNSSGNYEDMYRVRVTEGMTVEVTAYSDEIDTQIDAILPGGRSIYNDDYQGYNAGFLTSITETGTLEFRISSLYGNEEGEYEVVVTEVAPPEEITLGSVVNGSFGKSVGRERKADRYIFNGEEGQRINIELRSNSFDAYLEIEDSTGFQNYNDDGAGDYNSRLSYQFPEDGYVIITATSVGGDGIGTYELSISGGAETVVAEYEGALELGDSRAYDGTIFDVYEYQGSRGDSLTIIGESDFFDARLFLSNPDGTNLSSDDDSGGGTNSLISVSLPENGTYMIYITSFFEGTGPYRLQIMK